MTENEFHAKRRMFIVVGETVMVAPENYVCSHMEWLNSFAGHEKAQEWMEKCTRGYVLDNRAVAYTHGFSHRIDHRAFLLALKVLIELYDITEVGIGVRVSSESPWPVKNLIDLDLYLEHAIKLGKEIKENEQFAKIAKPE